MAPEPIIEKIENSPFSVPVSRVLNNAKHNRAYSETPK